jgi:hypothetical protein
VFLPNAREILDLKAALTREAGLIPIGANLISRGLFFGVFVVAAVREVGGRFLGFCLDLRQCLA